MKCACLISKDLKALCEINKANIFLKSKSQNMKPTTRLFTMCHVIRRLVFSFHKAKLCAQWYFILAHFSTTRHGSVSVNLIFISHPLKWRFHFGAAKRQKFVSGVIIQKSEQICPAHIQPEWNLHYFFVCLLELCMKCESAGGRSAWAVPLSFTFPAFPFHHTAAVALWMRSGASGGSVVVSLWGVLIKFEEGGIMALLRYPLPSCFLSRAALSAREKSERASEREKSEGGV